MQICSDDWNLKSWQVKTMCPPGCAEAGVLISGTGVGVTTDSVGIKTRMVAAKSGVGRDAESTTRVKTNTSEPVQNKTPQNKISPPAIAISRDLFTPQFKCLPG